MLAFLALKSAFVADENLHNLLLEDHSTQGRGGPPKALPKDEAREFA